MPALATAFADACAESIKLASAADTLRVRLANANKSLLPVSRIELLYELAFLRMFIAWESFLEESLVRYLCGYTHRSGPEALVAGTYFATLEGARTAIRGGRDFVLWHNPQVVIDRSRKWLSNARHELVLASSLGKLANYAAIRHRIAHAQSHAKDEFDRATMVLVARRYRGSRPGRFLRDWCPGLTPPTRWVKRIGDDLIGLAHQIAPT